MKWILRRHPFVNRQRLPLAYARLKVAAYKSVNEIISNRQPPPERTRHMSHIHLRENQLVYITEINIVVLLVEFILKTF